MDGGCRCDGERVIGFKAVDDGEVQMGRIMNERQWAKMATSTMNGMYVTRDTPVMIRQRIRHVLASVGEKGRIIV